MITLLKTFFSNFTLLFALLLIILFLSMQTAHAVNAHDIILSDEERAWIEQKHMVKIRVESWPPFMITDGEPRGIAVEYIQKIFDLHGISFTFITSESITWKDALEHIRQRTIIDMVPTAKITEDRQKFMLFTDEYLFLPWVIFSRNDYQFIGSIDDLKGRTVCVQDGYVMHTLLEERYPDITLRKVTGKNMTEQCISLLSAGKVDGYIGNLAVGTYLIQNNGYTNVKVASPTPFGNHNQAMGIRNDWPELVSIINKTLRTITPEEHAEIRNKWLSVRYEYGLRTRDILKWVFMVASAFTVVITSILLWNRRLNKEIATRQRIETQLRESEERFRALSDASFEAIFIVRGSTIIEANKTSATMSGYSIDELIGKNVLDIIAPDEHEKIIARLTRDAGDCYESIGLRKDGTTLAIEIQTKSFSYQGSNVKVAAVADISSQKEAEAELKILRGILPICSFCKKIRDDEGYWQQVDVYIHQHSEADISHGICPECVKKHYPDIVL